MCEDGVVVEYPGNVLILLVALCVPKRTFLFVGNMPHTAEGPHVQDDFLRMGNRQNLASLIQKIPASVLNEDLNSLCGFKIYTCKKFSVKKLLN